MPPIDPPVPACKASIVFTSAVLLAMLLLAALY
jgi:hypothetical protein